MAQWWNGIHACFKNMSERMRVRIPPELPILKLWLRVGNGIHLCFRHIGSEEIEGSNPSVTTNFMEVYVLNKRRKYADNC